MKKLKVSSSQYSYVFGNKQVHFPYSIASVVSYALSDEKIRENFHFEKVFLVRDTPEIDAQNCKDSDILLCSCYSWNWEITNFLAKSVKETNPNCLIVYGGPEVPDHDSTFFEKYPHVDYVVHGEGEIVLRDFLLEAISDKKFEKISSLESKNFRNPVKDRIIDLDVIPSPYTTGLMWNLVDRDSGYNYVATWETNRGCPYSCAFCDWGSNTKSKVRSFSEEKLFAEADWFGDNKIVYVDCADGNFGIFDKRDYRIADKLACVKETTSFPTGINLTWIKASSEKIFPIARRLRDVGLLRAVTLSVQSLDQNVLSIIKRKNIKFDDFSLLVKQFDDEGIQSYTELIMGLPGETLESYRRNWEILAGIYPSPSIMTWNCSVFVNAPMNDESYKKIHGIKTFISPVFMSHTSGEKYGILENEKMINETLSLPAGKINEIYLYNWIMLVFHSFGIFDFIARYFVKNYNVLYTDVYLLVEKFLQTTQTSFAKEYEIAKKTAENGYSGKGWEHVDKNLGEICWPVEEASWVRLARNEKLLAVELNKLAFFVSDSLTKNEPTNAKIINDLCNFQLFLLNLPTNHLKIDKVNSEFFRKKYQYDWKNFFENNSALQEKNVIYSRKASEKVEDLIQWGYQTMWFGRRSQKSKAKIREIYVEDYQEVSECVS